MSEACTQAEVLGEGNYTKTLCAVNSNIQNLTDYFSRPICVIENDIPTSLRSRISHTSYISLSSVFDSWVDGRAKLNGVYGARFSMVFTLQVATTPFHQGVLALSFQYGDVDGTNTYSRSVFSSTCTNLPHVRLDLASDTMVQLKVPFMHQYEYMAPGAQNYGRLALNSILATPTVTGLPTATYQIFLHLEDIELFGAGANSTASITLQAGKRLSPLAEEFEQESFPFSSATMALSRTVKWISKGVPAISSIAGPASWFLEKAAGTIRSFGFSKPLVTEVVQRVFRVDGVMEQNVDVAAPYSLVGPLSTNTLAVTPYFGGTDTDEMAIKFVTSQWSQIRYGKWDDTDAVRTILWATNVSPAFAWFRADNVKPYCNIRPPTVATASSNSFIASSLFNTASMFRYWRGTIKYRITFGKTKMHGGRIMITYHPILKQNSDVLAYSDTNNSSTIAAYGTNGPNPFGYSKVFNLRDDSVVEFEVPYISAIPYLNFASSTGGLAVYVIDKLQAPSMVANSIDFLVEVCGGDDFELANPIGPRYPVHNLGTPMLQAGKWLSNAPEALVQHTIGESITSLKQLISIPKTSTARVYAAEAYFNFDIPPWYYQPNLSVLTPALTSFPAETFGFGGNLASCYTFVKGGTDFHIYAAYIKNDTDKIMCLTQSPSTQSLDVNIKSPADVGTSSTSKVFVSGRSGHFRLPAYQNCSRLYSWILNDVLPSGTAWGVNGVRNLTNVNSTFDSRKPSSMYNITVDIGAVQARLDTSRSAADDAAMALYIGPPPLALLNANGVGNYDPDVLFDDAV